MQSETRIALPYIPARAPRSVSARGAKRTRLVVHLRKVLPDLLIVWDLLAVLLSASASTALLSAAGVASIQMTVSGLLLAPLLIRARGLQRVDAAMAAGLTQRVVLLVALAAAVTAMAERDAAILPARLAAELAAWAGLAVAFCLAGRAGASALLAWGVRQHGGERVAVIGAGNEAEWLRRALLRSKPAGIDLVTPGRRGGSRDGAIADLLEQGRLGALDRVVLAQPGLSNECVQQLAHRLKALQIEVASLFPLLGAGGVRPGTELAGIPLFLVARRPQWGYGGLSKQLTDRCLALLLLAWMTPLLLLIGLAIRLDSPGPILFRQRRHGLNGGEFDIYKFRTMFWEGGAGGSGAVQTGRRDRRITWVGAFLRQSSLDEVPQLLNVLNGTMSLVGPRPHPTAMRTAAQSGEEIVAEYPHRHRVKPGITGWAQVNGLRGATETADQLRRRIEHDNFYIENWSPWFDLRILAMTPVSLLIRRDRAF